MSIEQDNNIIVPQTNASQERTKRKYKPRTKLFDNPVRNIKIDKLLLYIPVGESGEKLTKAQKVLEEITGLKPNFGKDRFTYKSFGVRVNDQVSCYITLTKEDLYDIFERGLKVKELELKAKYFSKHGDIGFTVKEHIELGARYDPYLGIFPIYFFATLCKLPSRLSFRTTIKGRKCKEKVTKEEAIEWFKYKYDGRIV